MVTDDSVEQFQRDGVVCIRQQFRTHEIDDLRAPRRWRTSPEFHGFTDELPAGAPMEHPLFPMVWRP
jgi:hypothetical protein